MRNQNYLLPVVAVEIFAVFRNPYFTNLTLGHESLFDLIGGSPTVK